MKLWDMSDMYALINEYPRQFERGFRIAEQINLPKSTITNVIITAVGHDAAVAKIVCDLFEANITIPITIKQELADAKTVTKQTLIINLAVTYYPEEMVKLTKKYYVDGAKIITITTGGEPEIFARDRQLPLILLDDSLSEWKFRMGSGLIIAILTHVLTHYGILPQQTRSHMLQTTTKLDGMYLTKLGEKIAKFMIASSVSLLYTPSHCLGLSHLIKNLTNTLLQLPCFVGLLSDYKYSENYGFSGKNWNKFFALIIQDNDTANNPAVLVQKQLNARKIDSFIWKLNGQNKLEKSLSTIMLFYWAIYWALKTRD
ncbi:MAG: hypothetical protein V1719_00850 [Patescibacteria group bacterium]